MKKQGVDILLVQSTDRYLNEYVPTDESCRVWISGFTGSMGEVIIAPRKAYVVVDGRYWIQADNEVDPKLYEVVRVTHGSGIDAAVHEVIRKIAGRSKARKLKVGYEPDRVTPHGLERLRRALEATSEPRLALKPLYPSPVEVARGEDTPDVADAGLRAVDEKRVGLTVKQKVGQIGKWLESASLDALLVQRLDDIAYLTNLRGTQLPYQATFKALALVTPDGLTVGMDTTQVPDAIRKARPDVDFVSESKLWRAIGKTGKTSKKGGFERVGYDPDDNTEHARALIERRKGTAVPVSSPVGPMKAYKTAAELDSMKDAFRRADQVVDTVIRWANTEVRSGRRVTEKSFADRVMQTFVAHGAVGLSFKVISAAGKNGAIIHYSDPSPRRALKAGELMLLDTGAYFDEGYATDLTRTFLVGGTKTRATDEQRRYFTLVLKAAMAGMRATFPEGTRSAQIDALVRAPLWAEGLNYAHGTGHGVGINVHEFPPRIGPGGDSVLEPGMVFSIEPGIYMPSFGGIRVENLCTVEPVPDKEGFLRVVPLTFSPIDKRLVEPKLLTADEKAWLKSWQDQYVPAASEPIVAGDADAPAPKAKPRKARGRTARNHGKAARRPR